MLKSSRGILRGRSLSDLLRDDVCRYGFTHALRIPIATQTSRPQFTKSLQYAMSDQTAAHIHPAIFEQSGVYCITLGYLTLATPDVVESALQFLKDLMLDRILSEIIQNRHTEVDSPGKLKPLRVSVSGLEGYNQSLTGGLCRLYAPVVDHTGLLSAFVRAVRAEFISAGFAKLRLIDRSRQVPIPLHVKLIGNVKLNVKEVNRKPSIQSRLPKDFVLFKTARFDMREFCNRFQNMTWASDFALERLCIGGLKRFEIIKDGRSIDHGFEEIASVPLPGINQLDEDPFLKDVEYAKLKPIILDENNVEDTRDMQTICNDYLKRRRPKQSQF